MWSVHNFLLLQQVLKAVTESRTADNGKLLIRKHP